MEVGREVFKSATVGDDMFNILDSMDMEVCEEGIKRWRKNAKVAKDCRGRVKEGASRSQDDDVCLQRGCPEQGGCGVERMRVKDGEARVRREGRGIINSPASSCESMNQGKVLRSLGCEGINVEGFNCVADLDNA